MSSRETRPVMQPRHVEYSRMNHVLNPINPAVFVLRARARARARAFDFFLRF